MAGKLYLVLNSVLVQTYFALLVKCNKTLVIDGNSTMHSSFG